MAPFGEEEERKEQEKGKEFDASLLKEKTLTSGHSEEATNIQI